MPMDAPFGKGAGTITYHHDDGTLENTTFYADRCPPQPRGDLLAQKNPTCDLRYYTGGLSTCHHGWTLLDKAQGIPWEDKPLVIYKKFRVYFQEFKPADAAASTAASHMELQRHDWGIGADGDYAEYDVPKAPAGTPPSETTHTITGTWKPVPHSKNPMHLIAFHAHCHAPTCRRVELWNNDTGKLMCANVPIYGGTGKIDLKRFDEPGYIGTPPCLWGDEKYGLEAPPLVSGMTIKVVAITNNTFGHHGEMALPEISMVQGPL